MKATYSPANGVIAVAGQVTPQSYIVSPACRLTGGFAFAVWTADIEGAPRPGEFVVTLGGYHPHFPPAGRLPPSAPDRGANWDPGGADRQGQHVLRADARVRDGGRQPRGRVAQRMTWRCPSPPTPTSCSGGSRSTTRRGQRRSRLQRAAAHHGDHHVHAQPAPRRLAGALRAAVRRPRARRPRDIVSFTVAFGNDKPERKPIPWDRVQTQRSSRPRPGAARWRGRAGLTSASSGHVENEGVGLRGAQRRAAFAAERSPPCRPRRSRCPPGRRPFDRGRGRRPVGVGPVGIADGRPGLRVRGHGCTGAGSPTGRPTPQRTSPSTWTSRHSHADTAARRCGR